MTKEETLTAYLALFNNLETGLTTDSLTALTTSDVHFVDPFNDVKGQASMYRVLAHFKKQVASPRFEIQHIAWSADTCFLRWEFTGRLPKLGEWSFPGMTELHFTHDGLISLHQDHWDAGQHFYQKLPIVGSALRFIKRKLQINSDV